MSSPLFVYGSPRLSVTVFYGSPFILNIFNILQSAIIIKNIEIDKTWDFYQSNFLDAKFLQLLSVLIYVSDIQTQKLSKTAKARSQIHVTCKY